MPDPLFSIVVPVYKVRALLRECLDSVLEQSFADFELIAVDDASPDGSGAVLDEYAAADPRVRVLHLDANVGLGPARNAGIDLARGRYLTFLDSDDLLTPGALGRVADRISSTGDPDIVMFDYARLYWDGRTVRNRLGPLFSAPGPEIVTARQRPDLLTVLMVVWNKVYRRDFVERHGFRFPTGFYEDLPWTYPAMISAERIALLDDICCLYRQRRSGNILRSQSRKHFDVFDQYRRVFDYVDSHDELRDWHAFFFDRMVTHCIEILTNKTRISPEMRRDFFAETVAICRQYLPARYPSPPGAASRLRVRAVASGNYREFQAVQLAQASRSKLRSGVRRGKTRTTAWSAVGKRQVDQVRYRAQRRAPIDESLAVYSAAGQTAYSGSPAAIYECARQDATPIRGVWVVRSENADRVPPGVEVVEPGTADYYRLLARAKFLVTDDDFPDDFVKRPGQVFVQTHRGTPLQATGIGLRDYPIAAAGIDFSRLLERSDRWDFSLSANRFSSDVWERAFPGSFTSLECGSPANDRLACADAAEYRRQRERLGIEEAETVVLYAPVSRDWAAEGADLPLDLATASEKLGDGWSLLVRAPGSARRPAGLEELDRCGQMRDVTHSAALDDLMIAADVLITDYSPVMVDYALLDRPIVLYADDWETYRRVLGMNVDLLARPPGVVETTVDGLVDALLSGRFRDPDAAARRREFRAFFGEFDDGHAAERVVRRVFLGRDR